MAATIIFWATPPQRTQPDPMLEHLGRQRQEGGIRLAREGDAIVATMSVAWEAQDGTPVMAEERRFTVRADATFHQVSVESRLQALDSEIVLPVTKFAGLGVRLDVRLTQLAGAVFPATQDMETQISCMEGPHPLSTSKANTARTASVCGCPAAAVSNGLCADMGWFCSIRWPKHLFAYARARFLFRISLWPPTMAPAPSRHLMPPVA